MRTNRAAPELDDAVPPARRDIAALHGVPRKARVGAVVGGHLLEHLAGLPVPEPQIAFAVAAANELAVRRDDGLQREAAYLVAVEALAGVVHHGVHALVDGDLVVQRLAEDVVPAGVELQRGHRGHVGLLDVARGGVVAEVPAQHLPVVGGAHELAALLVEAHRVHRRLVVVVAHRALRLTPRARPHLARAHVELVDAGVLAGAQEHVRVGGRPDGLEGDGALGVVAEALAALRVPQLHVLVEGRGQERRAVGAERHPPHAARVAHVATPQVHRRRSRALHVALVVHVPDLDLRVSRRTHTHLGVHGGGQQQMAVGGEELDARHGVRVAGPARQAASTPLPLVDALVGQVALGVVHGLHVRRVHDPGAAQVVLLFLAVELGGRLVDRDAQALRLERVHRRLLVLRVGAHHARADPLGLTPPARRYLAHLLVLRARQCHTLPLRHLALLLVGHRVLRLPAVARPRALPPVHVARYASSAPRAVTVSRRLALLLQLLRVVGLACVEDGLSAVLLVEPLVSHRVSRAVRRRRVAEVVEGLVLLLELEGICLDTLRISWRAKAHFHKAGGHIRLAVGQGVRHIRTLGALEGTHPLPCPTSVGLYISTAVGLYFSCFSVFDTTADELVYSITVHLRKHLSFHLNCGSGIHVHLLEHRLRERLFLALLLALVPLVPITLNEIHSLHRQLNTNGGDPNNLDRRGA